MPRTSAYALIFGILAGVLSWGETLPRDVIAYVFVKDRVLQASELDAAKLTRVNYAFANLRDGEVVEGFTHDAANYAVLTELRARHPRLQVLASVGGWTWSGGFSGMAATAAGRAKFIASAVRFVERYGLDGLDIDWEYPGIAGAGNPFRADDKIHYSALLRELRARFDAEEPKAGRKLLISVAAGASLEYLAHTDMATVARYVDTVNLMSYDYYESGSDKTTGHHAPLHVNPLDPKKVSVEASVKAFLAAGVPADRLVLGVPFYGHAWSNVAGERHGLFEPGKPSNLQVTYHSVVEDLLRNGYARYWDAVAGAPYLYNGAARSFVSYEDVESVGLKAQFAVAEHLRGVMFWEYAGDDREALLGAIVAGLQ